MSGIQIGPLAFDAARLSAIVVALVFFAVFEIAAIRRARRGEHIGRWALPAVLGWLLAARAGYIAQNWEVFAAYPLDMLKIWQGGVSIRSGFVGLGLVCLAAIVRRPHAVAPMVAAAALAWVTSEATRDFAPDPARGRVPDMTFQTLSGETLALDDRDGKPLVLNLWATWCPPCRREMPMMMDVAETVRSADMIFANQGEDHQRVARFLETLHLEGSRVVRDRDSLLMDRFGALGMPTTLFFDPSGALTALHFGEISRAELVRRIDEARSPVSNTRPPISNGDNT